MCNVDTGVLGQVWTVDNSGKELQAFPDFNSKHTCKNFEDMKEWSRKLMVRAQCDYLSLHQKLTLNRHRLQKLFRTTT